MCWCDLLTKSAQFMSPPTDGKEADNPLIFDVCHAGGINKFNESLGSYHVVYWAEFGLRGCRLIHFLDSVVQWQRIKGNGGKVLKPFIPWVWIGLLVAAVRQNNRSKACRHVSCNHLVWLKQSSSVTFLRGGSTTFSMCLNAPCKAAPLPLPSELFRAVRAKRKRHLCYHSAEWLWRRGGVAALHGMFSHWKKYCICPRMPLAWSRRKRVEHDLY